MMLVQTYNQMLQAHLTVGVCCKHTWLDISIETTPPHTMRTFASVRLSMISTATWCEGNSPVPPLAARGVPSLSPTETVH